MLEEDSSDGEVLKLKIVSVTCYNVSSVAVASSEEAVGKGEERPEEQHRNKPFSLALPTRLEVDGELTKKKHKVSESPRRKRRARESWLLKKDKSGSESVRKRKSSSEKSEPEDVEPEADARQKVSKKKNFSSRKNRGSFLDSSSDDSHSEHSAKESSKEKLSSRKNKDSFLDSSSDESHSKTRQHSAKNRDTGSFLDSSSDESRSEHSAKESSKKVGSGAAIDCSFCNKQFSGVARFIHHLRQRDCRVFCPFEGCGYQPALAGGHFSAYWSSTLSTLAQHIKAKHTREAELQCHICGKRLVTPEAYKYHVGQHGNALKFYCQTCQKFFPARSKREHRQKYHSSWGSYPCSVCNKLLSTFGNLKIHMQVHTGDHAYKCEICPRKFHQKNNWLVHCLRRHGINNAA